ncbi:YwqI/YxiC family protein [Bacillus gobiensis]|uniref:YwqI/YxiC family protein n=1 Tax=Bacillus gobiensis TaxID=1441095 RepID=UPI003D196F7E
MTTIQLRHKEVISKLNEINQAVEGLSLRSPSASSLGDNKLDFTAKWLEREKNIHELVSQYKEAVQKNLEDTRDNVNTLKEQDQAIK